MVLRMTLTWSISSLARGLPIGWRLVLVTVAFAVAVTGCSSASTSPKVSQQAHGVITGLAQECSGSPVVPPHPVEVALHQGDRLIVRQTQLGSHTYRFSEPPGTYVVTSNQSYVVPITVTLRAGKVAHADLMAACD